MPGKHKKASVRLRRFGALIHSENSDSGFVSERWLRGRYRIIAYHLIRKRLPGQPANTLNS